MINALKWIWKELLFISVLIIYFIAAFLIISGFYLFFTGQKTLGDTVLILAAAVASLSVVYLAEQIRVAGEQEQVKRSYEYFARYNSEAFKETTTEACAFIRDGGKTKDKKMDILINRKNPQYKTIRPIISLYFNFFEDMAILYNRKLLNRELIRSFFKSISLSIYNDGKDCIDKLRVDANSTTLFKEWEKMNEDFNIKKIRGER